jgi:hypothetical protein
MCTRYALNKKKEMGQEARNGGQVVESEKKTGTAESENTSRPNGLGVYP